MKKKSVLIISEDSTLSEELRLYFLEKYDVLIANNAISALEFLEMDRYSRKIYSIILDLDLSDDVGFTFLDNMRIDTVFSEIPIVALLSDGCIEAELQAYKSGVLSCILKPVNSSIVFQQVDNFVKTMINADTRLESIILKQQTYISEELELRANIDSLTGLYNRYSFFEKTEQMLKENQDKDFVLVRMNIERFKVINDIFGSTIGDLILIDIAHALKRIMPPESVFCRFVDDHFIACFENSSITVEEILSEIEREIQVHALNYQIQIKMGVYPIEDRFIPVGQMCDRANMTLQTIKGNYLKKIVYYDKNLRDVLLQEQVLVDDMQLALKRGEFEIYLQPIVSLLDDKIASAEALVRWNHHKRGLIAPGGFIPFFEKSGLIAKLDHYVWESVFKYQKERKEKKLGDLPISVNISRMSLYNPSLADDIISLSKKYEVEPSLVKLEITESAYHDNPVQLLDTMKVLQEYGFLILMDDFGSGYSSLNMLKNVPVDILKIDMCFLQDFGKQPKTANILTSIVRMAKWLNIPVVCEGVENQNQFDFLKEIGADYVQGFYFSKPIPTSEFERFETKNLSDHRRVNPFVTSITDFDAIFDNNEFVSRLFNTFVGAVGFYEFNDERLEILRVNDNYYSLMGYTPESFHSDKTNVFEMVVPEDRSLLIETCKQAVNGMMPSEIHVRRYLSDGCIIWLSVVIRFVGGTDNRWIICCAFNNITDQKINELRIKEQSDSLTNYVEIMNKVAECFPFAFVQYSLDGKHLFFSNRKCYEMFGLNRKTDYILKKSEPDFNLLETRKTGNFHEALKKVKKSGKAENYTSEIHLESGEVHKIQGSLSVIEYHDGQKVIQDIFNEII